MEKNVIFDNLSSLVNEATNTAKGLGKEAQNIITSQVEKAIAKLDLVKSEEFEVIKEMVTNLTNENETLKKHLSELETKYNS